MSTKRNPAELSTQYRPTKIEAKPKEGERLSWPDPGRFSFALTSEEPVRRWFGNEILNHHMNQHLGRVDGFTLKDGVLRVECQFGNSPLAQEKRRDWHSVTVLEVVCGGVK